MNKTICRVMVLGAVSLLSTGPASSGLAFSVLAVSAPAPAAAAQTVAEKAVQIRARALLEEFYAVKLERLWAAFTPDVKAQWGTLDGFTQYRKTGVEQFGAQKELVAEKTFMRGGVTYYVRSATFEKSPQVVWAVAFGFDQLGRVSDFGISLEHDRSGDQVALGSF
ncbi:hypothetical protein EHF33_00725 [Deinococcus psychrotolerans]|uniref:DUF3887 domain-containing protein n=1 Tax=Deinococcus psychrotolerans TaxID=2489213 RepID=A0A3G8Y7V4_9DEIO|nr:hypothetical protein [Deinococcus psychrotolerans]AZI41459.1 hypothetical protein EHF33_00725 [Deinococcus psychrotolerans]